MRKVFTNLTGGVLLCIFSIVQSFAQNIAVKGVVTDAKTKETLVGVSVRVKGVTSGTSTGATGGYAISVAPTATLVFSYIGYQTLEVPVSNRTDINVQLVSSATELQQVVVVGYGTQRKVDVTGAVAQVKGEEISKQSTPNAVSALQGKVAGVQITNAGTPGSSPQIRIRGLGTVYGNANPLYVVDGAWYDDISFLNPADIENMSILKDASSESIYGIRAANGVVLITTRKGKGQPRVSYDGYAGFQHVTNLVKMANASQYATLINELNSQQTFANPSSFGDGTDWYNVVLRDAFTTNQYLSFGGSTEKSSYNYSVGYFKQDGIVKNNDYSRVTARLQNDIQAAKFLKVGYNAVLQGNNTTDIPPGIIGKAYTAAPVVPVFYADGTYGDPADYPIGNVPNNPQAQLDFYNQKSKNYRVTGNVYADVKLMKDLTFRSSFGGEFGDGEVRAYNPVYQATTYQFNKISLLTLTKSQTRNWIWENTLTYDKTLGDHKFTILAGQSAQRYKSYSSTGTAQNVPYNSEGDLYLALGTSDTRSITDQGDLSTYESYFGRVNYSFKNRYLINASLRADGSSKFIDDQRWGYFPSIGVGWVVSDEDFMKDQKFFSSLKLRGSWGKVGNASVPANLSTLTVNQQPQFTAIYGGVPATGANITTIVPPVTYWERGVGTDIGLETSFLDSKLTFEVDWYNKKTEQAIFQIPILGSLGTTGNNILGNQADFQNRGWEFTAGWRNKINDDFSYNLSGNFSINNNKVLSVETGGTPIYAGGAAATGGQLSTRTVVGQPIGQFFGLQVDGVFQNAAEIAASVQPSAKPGDFRYQDTNSDGKIDAADRVVLGNPNPKYTFGLNTGFNFKEFDLAVDVQGVAGVDVYNANKGLRFGSENYSEDFFNNRWHGEGTSNSYPSANIGGGENYKPNSWYVEDGSYVRIRNIQLGYTFPSALLSKWKIQRLRVYLNAQNAFNFFKYNGFTPELRITDAVTQPGINAGIDNGIYPLFATYNFGLNLTF
ncbi:SusC/RagA family TonB-linked outer membrane protein [Pedobacter sp. HMF7647]|uniref:SusC/RagA family TonB-linked outer membrane protein n=1 Tax=Hufsiella arboris TaxID=2695275 RepID=A0A7K1YF84_9SPHI|nr:TonB-dependent receptor [Hufsiella arboris]MXV53051.1 SusC/RagA family TonB-linked outer membrane protein [Hufsiella arboris]